MPTYPVQEDDEFPFNALKPTPLWVLCSIWLLAAGALFLPGWYSSYLSASLAVFPFVYLFIRRKMGTNSLEDLYCPRCKRKLSKPVPYDIGDEDGKALIYDCDYCQISWDSQVREVPK